MTESGVYTSLATEFCMRCNLGMRGRQTVKKIIQIIEATHNEGMY